MNDRTPPTPEPQWPGVPAPPTSDLRPPAIHQPYLIGAGLFCLSEGVVIHLPPDGVAASLAHGTAVVAWLVHLVWLHCLYADGERHLGEELPMPAGRVLVLALILCILLPLWTAFALTVLLRSAFNALASRNPDGPFPISRYARDAPGLAVAAVMALLVNVVLVIRLETLGAFESGSDSAPAALLGSTPSALYTVFHVAIGGYYLWFVARAVPALYRGYALLKPEGTPRE